MGDVIGNFGPTIRHAKQAVRLIIDGASANIQTGMPKSSSPYNVEDIIGMMVEEIIEEALTTENIPCPATQAAWDMITSMQAMLGEPECPAVVRELLSNHGLNP